METVAIFGAGELGATLARRLAEADRFRKIVLIDPDEGKARGKALDILQSAPVEGHDTSVVGAAGLEAASEADALVVAEPPGLPAAPPGTPPPESFVRRVVQATGARILLIADARAAPLVEAAVRGGLPRHLVLGSAPLATAAALRRCLGEELDAGASEITLSVLGLPPDQLILPRGSATLGGLPIERLSPVAERRAAEAVRRRVPGPLALAAAAERVLLALRSARPAVLPVFAALEGEYGHRRMSLAVPARLGHGRLLGVVEISLEPVDRTAFDTIAARPLALPRT
jgi:malate dehydrogenase